MLSLFLTNLLFVLATILPILNPPAVAPIFWTMTSGANNQTRKMLSKRVAINVFIMILGAIFLGNIVLSMLGISLSVVRVGGGLLVIAAAWKLLNAEDPDTGLHPMEAEYSIDKAKKSAFYPLTFPMTCGPGTIAAAITVGASLQNSDWNLAGLATLGGTLIGVGVVSLTVFFCLRFAAQFLHRLGQNGTVIFMRLSAFILLCVGVQILWAGIHDLIINLFTEVAAIK